MATSLPSPSPIPPGVATNDRRRRPARRTVELRLAWIPAQDMQHPGWVEAGHQLGRMSRVSNWWVGDWLRYGTTRWGERYVEASRITGYDVKTLRNLVYVARHFDLSRRRDKLHWSHHAELAGLEPEEQDHWLDRALGERLSVSDLRIELRSSQRRANVAATAKSHVCEPDDNAASMICPHCGRTISLPTGREVSR